MIQSIFSWFSWLFSQMEPSDWVDMIAILASTFVGIISVIIAVLTLRQNNRMIEESNRPYITIYGETTCVETVVYYIVLKNFGNTGATITDFHTDIDLSSLVNNGDPTPFKDIIGTFIAPKQSFRAALLLQTLKNVPDEIYFQIVYKTSNRHYKEDVRLKVNAHSSLASITPVLEDKNLQAIACAIQDLSVKKM